MGTEETMELSSNPLTLDDLVVEGNPQKIKFYKQDMQMMGDNIQSAFRSLEKEVRKVKSGGEELVKSFSMQDFIDGIVRNSGRDFLVAHNTLSDLERTLTLPNRFRQMRSMSIEELCKEGGIEDPEELLTINGNIKLAEKLLPEVEAMGPDFNALYRGHAHINEESLKG